MNTLRWYKLEQRAILDSYHGLSMEEKAAAYTILNIIYDRGGACPNDSRFLAYHIGHDCSPRKAGRLLISLVEKGKFTINGTEIHQKRATCEIEITKKFLEKTSEAGKIGAHKKWENHKNQSSSDDEPYADPIGVANARSKTLEVRDSKKERLPYGSPKKESDHSQEILPTPNPHQPDVPEIPPRTKPKSHRVIYPPLPRERFPDCYGEPPKQKTSVHDNNQHGKAAAIAPTPGESTRGTRIPDDWHLDEQSRAYAHSQGIKGQAADRMALDFFQYWRAKAGKDAVKCDWVATWQRWVRNSHNMNSNDRGQNRSANHRLRRRLFDKALSPEGIPLAIELDGGRSNEERERDRRGGCGTEPRQHPGFLDGESGKLFGTH